MKYILITLFLVQIVSAQYIRDSSSETILNTSSLLMWQDNNESQSTTATWENAISYCESLTLASYSDWRLPNINELISITDDTTYNPSSNSTFKNVKSDKYWSSTTYMYTNYNYKHAYYINFADSSIQAYDKTNLAYVRCVRNFN